MGTLNNAINFPFGKNQTDLSPRVDNIWRRLKNVSRLFSDREERAFQDKNCNMNVSLGSHGLHRPDGRQWVGRKGMTGDKAALGPYIKRSWVP